MRPFWGLWKRALFQYKLPNEELKAWGWNCEMPSWIWKSYSCLRLVAACSKIARASVKVRKTKLLPLVLLRKQKRISEPALSSPLVGSLRSEMTGERVSLHFMLFGQLSIFTKNKAFHHKQRHFNCCFLSSFYFLSIISAFVTNIMSFIEALFKLRICLFLYMFSGVLAAGIKENLIFHFSSGTLLLLRVVSKSYLLRTNSLSLLCLSESRGVFNLGHICQNSEAKFESQLIANPCTVFW